MNNLFNILFLTTISLLIINDTVSLNVFKNKKSARPINTTKNDINLKDKNGDFKYQPNVIGHGKLNKSVYDDRTPLHLTPGSRYDDLRADRQLLNRPNRDELVMPKLKRSSNYPSTLYNTYGEKEKADFNLAGEDSEDFSAW